MVVQQLVQMREKRQTNPNISLQHSVYLYFELSLCQSTCLFSLFNILVRKGTEAVRKTINIESINRMWSIQELVLLGASYRSIPDEAIFKK